MHGLCFPPSEQYPLSASFVNSIPRFFGKLKCPLTLSGHLVPTELTSVPFL